MKQRQMISPLWDLFRDKHNKRVSQCRSGTSCVVATQTHARQGRLRHYIYIYIYIFVLFYFYFCFLLFFQVLPQGLHQLLGLLEDVGPFVSRHDHLCYLRRCLGRLFVKRFGSTDPRCLSELNQLHSLDFVRAVQWRFI